MGYKQNNETTRDENEGFTCMTVNNNCRNIKKIGLVTQEVKIIF